MKVRSLVFVCIVATMFVLMAVPVSANGPLTGTTTLTGTVPAYLSISLASPSVGFGTFDPGTPATSTNTITVVANEPWKITVADTTERVSSEQGYMGNYTSSSYGSATVSGLNTTLGSPLEVKGLLQTGNAQILTAADLGTSSLNKIPDVTAPVTLYTGSQITSPTTLDGHTSNTAGQLLDNDYTQPVAYTDQFLPSPSVYQISLVYTIQTP